MRKKLILYFKRRNHARKQWVSHPRPTPPSGALGPVQAAPGHARWDPSIPQLSPSWEPGSPTGGGRVSADGPV